jgi:adenylate cyclase
MLARRAARARTGRLIGMGREIERKFLVSDESWREAVAATKSLRQAYLARTDRLSARVRIIDDKEAFLTMKSAEAGMTRAEFEYAIPVEDARELMELGQGRLIEKVRHIVETGGARWEIDVFDGELAGLVIAEIEFSDAGAHFERPAWLGREVTGDPAYYNATLALEGLPHGGGHA